MHPDDKVSVQDRELGLTILSFQDNHSPKKKEPHIKKPLNAFMLYMKVLARSLTVMTVDNANVFRK